MPDMLMGDARDDEIARLRAEIDRLRAEVAALRAKERDDWEEQTADNIRRADKAEAALAAATDEIVPVRVAPDCDTERTAAALLTAVEAAEKRAADAYRRADAAEAALVTVHKAAVADLTAKLASAEARVAALEAAPPPDPRVHATLRSANAARQREWDPSDKITLAYRGNELAGEVGEACNVIKKLEREALGIAGSRATRDQLADELADVVICADLVAMHAGIDLNAAVARKFNATSEKVGMSTRMSAAPIPDPRDAEIERLRDLLALLENT